ncbi:MAG: hypothetical protein IT176_03970 [Acidobacteria bacterium]|nr:hypothetical protein [Acidobacteriota bacterium]
MSGIQIDGRWFCSQECVERMARQLLAGARPLRLGVPAVAPPRLGVLLLHERAITAGQLTRAIASQPGTGLRLGAQLCADGACDEVTVLRALAAQAGARFVASIAPSAVADAPGGLPREAVRALGVVPFTLPEVTGRIRVACAAPIPRAALAALRRLTGWTLAVYLVSDTTFAALRDAYGSATDRPPRVELVRTSTVADAATRIAAAAAGSRRMTMADAHWAPYTWVRVTAEGIVRDVLLENAEESCQAASTLH